MQRDERASLLDMRTAKIFSVDIRAVISAGGQVVQRG